MSCRGEVWAYGCDERCAATEAGSRCIKPNGRWSAHYWEDVAILDGLQLPWRSVVREL